MGAFGKSIGRKHFGKSAAPGIFSGRGTGWIGLDRTRKLERQAARKVVSEMLNENQGHLETHITKLVAACRAKAAVSRGLDLRPLETKLRELGGTDPARLNETQIAYLVKYCRDGTR